MLEYKAYSRAQGHQILKVRQMINEFGTDLDLQHTSIFPIRDNQMFDDGRFNCIDKEWQSEKQYVKIL